MPLTKPTAMIRSMKPAQRGVISSLFVKIFLAIVVLVTLALLAAILVTKKQGDAAAKIQIDRDLKQILAAQKSDEDNAFTQIQFKTDFVSSDPNVAQYFSAASGDDLGLSDTQTNEGSASILDLLDERMKQLNLDENDVAIVVDANGEVLARGPATVEQLQENLKTDPFVGAAITDEEVSPRSGYWLDKGQLYIAAISPISSGDNLVGFALLGKRVDQTAADRIAQISNASVAIFQKDGDAMKLIGTSLNESAKPALVKLAESKDGMISQTMASMGTDSKRLEVVLDGRTWTGEMKLIRGERKAPIGAVLALTPTDASRASFIAIQKAVNWTGLCALLGALLASWFLSRAMLKPIRHLAAVAEKAAAGDFNLHVDASGKDEIGTLGRAVDSLLSSLREKGDMEGFVGSLTKHLPEQMGTGVSQSVHMTPSRDARRLHMSLLALDLRGFAQAVSEGGERARLEELSDLHVQANLIAREHDGLMLEQSGTRLVLGFGGERKQIRALTALQELLTAMGSKVVVAMAAHDGEVVHGTLPNLDPALATIGAGIAQIQRLLTESSTGNVLLGPQFAKALLPVLGHEPSTVVGTASGKRFYALNTTDLQALPKYTRVHSAPADDQPVDKNATKLMNPAPVTPVGANAAARLPAGTRLGGRYEIQSVLGSGGMGVVYKAQDLKLDDVVALKMLKGAALLDPEHLERLKSELKLARKITHPNILRTHDFGELNGQPFISMEYVRGMTLRYLLDQSARLPYFAALRIARQVTAALDAAHTEGVLHRDIKPENVIIEASGNAKLMDFGIARPIRRTAPGQTQPGMFVGTPTYCSPEALAGDDVDARSDIYSMGVMFCELFCGKLPFEATGTMELYVAHSQEAPIAPSKMWPEIPKVLESIILKCLEKQAPARFNSATDLGLALSTLKA